MNWTRFTTLVRPHLPRIGQIGGVAVLGILLLVTYGYLVHQHRNKLSSLWFGTPRAIQYTAYGFWLLAGIGFIAYLCLARFRWWRSLLLALFLLFSIGWSLSLLFRWPKITTAVTLIMVALLCSALFVMETVQQKTPNNPRWLLCLCLVPLLIVTIGIDAGMWNAMFLGSST